MPSANPGKAAAPLATHRPTSDRWSRGGYRSATSAPMTPGPGGGRGRHRSRAARRRAGRAPAGRGRWAGGPPVARLRPGPRRGGGGDGALDCSSTAKGDVEARLTCAFVAEALHDLGSRLIGREAVWGWRTTPPGRGTATSSPATGVRTSRPNWPRWRALATSIRTSSWCRTVSGPSPTRRSRPSPNTSTAPTVTFPRASSPAWPTWAPRSVGAGRVRRLVGGRRQRVPGHGRRHGGALPRFARHRRLLITRPEILTASCRRTEAEAGVAAEAGDGRGHGRGGRDRARLRLQRGRHQGHGDASRGLGRRTRLRRQRSQDVVHVRRQSRRPHAPGPDRSGPQPHLPRLSLFVVPKPRGRARL